MQPERVGWGRGGKGQKRPQYLAWRQCLRSAVTILVSVPLPIPWLDPTYRISIEKREKDERESIQKKKFSVQLAHPSPQDYPVVGYRPLVFLLLSNLDNREDLQCCQAEQKLASLNSSKRTVEIVCLSRKIVAILPKSSAENRQSLVVKYNSLFDRPSLQKERKNIRQFFSLRRVILQNDTDKKVC